MILKIKIKKTHNIPGSPRTILTMMRQLDYAIDLSLNAYKDYKIISHLSQQRLKNQQPIMKP